VIANSLVVNRRRACASVKEALDRLGPQPVAFLVDKLVQPGFPRVAEEDRAGVAVRRASIAAAVAAERRSQEFGITREHAYTLGLLHTLAYADLLAVIEEMNLPPGRFRAALIEIYRPLVGRLRSEGWSLPHDLETVLTDDGKEDRPAAVLVRTARATLPDCAIGPLPASRVSAPEARATAAEVNRLFEFLALEPSASQAVSRDL
jgi:HD-like signal output (HDOD) protein